MQSKSGPERTIKCDGIQDDYQQENQRNLMGRSHQNKECLAWEFGRMGSTNRFVWSLTSNILQNIFSYQTRSQAQGEKAWYFSNLCDFQFSILQRWAIYLFIHCKRWVINFGPEERLNYSLLHKELVAFERDDSWKLLTIPSSHFKGTFLRVFPKLNHIIYKHGYAMCFWIYTYLKCPHVLVHL